MPEQTVGSYGDALQLWETALNSASGLRYRLQTIGQAVHMRQRMYEARRKVQKLTKEQIGPVPGFEPSTPYDTFVITIEDDKKQKVNDTKNPPVSTHFDMVIVRRKPLGEVLDLEGNPLDLAEPNSYSPTEDEGLELDD